MLRSTAVKASLCTAALLFSLGMGVKVQAAESASDVGLAGIMPALDNYYVATATEEKGEAEQLLETLVKQKDEPSSSEVEKVKSPYENLGISIANDYVNIRKEPNTDSEIVGKLYRGCATDILETKGEWVKIKSGKVKGYIKSEFLAIGEEAEKQVDEFADKYATVDTETLFVREKPTKDSAITTMIPLGESYYVTKEYDKWVKVEIDEGETGYVSKDFIKLDVKFKYAISIEEEMAKLAAEEAAKKAEAERLEQLARDKEAERQRQAAANAAANSNKSNGSKNSSSSNSGSSSSSSSSSSNNSASGSGSGSTIANYALNFVGNPYVWGGTSLTNGADCSGFVQSVYAHFGYSIPRTSRDQASSAGYEVSINNVQPGDLIFYTNSSGSINHVAMYIGNGKVVNASTARTGIKVSSYNYRSPYKVKRIVK
ncbi:C40 family peptidase [Anaerocolumna sp. AGMB13020]|uniref:C40 family peptidase n=1 Tax=Anaerocolumna sp. AGMB13020 TaxID=3081750 RepID=UPI0029530BA9|nr:C40 family peptidase [Anaerocolumna sp. AGMB13020]WOO38871.1 C40 family peptidase [Anaerocolumna sp. AGMB13020]